MSRRSSRPADEQLRRAYRRLMRVYPRWYRQDRGLELLTTLLDAAAPGQRRPGRADVADLLRGGMRARLRPPRGAGSYAVTTVIALWMAINVAGFPFLLIAAPTVAQTALFLAAKGVDGFTANDVQVPQFVLSALPALLPGATVVVAASTVLAVVLTALPTGAHGAFDTEHQPGRSGGPARTTVAGD